MLHKIYSQDLYCNELKELFRLNHRITEPGCDLWRYLIQSSAQGGSAGAGCPGPYPDGFWMASLVENAQALCAIYSSVWPPLNIHIYGQEGKSTEASQPDLHPSEGILQGNFSWKTFSHTWRAWRWFEVISMDLLFPSWIVWARRETQHVLGFFFCISCNLEINNLSGVSTESH